MTVLAQTLSDDTRVISGLRNNPLFSDTQIVDLLNDALGEARDKFVVALEHWFRATAPFTLTGNLPGSNTFDLTTIPDFQMDQAVNYLPGGNALPIPVTRMGSLQERAQVGNCLNIGSGWGRQYYTNGDLLFIEPFTSSAGNYQLLYTPQGVPLSTPQPIPPAVAGVPATFLLISGGGPPAGVSFTGALFTQANVGDTLVISNSSQGNNGSFPIVSVSPPGIVFVTARLFAESPGTLTATIQPEGTRPDLPAVLTPLALYLKVHAGIAIQTSRKQRTNELEGKLAKEEVRILALANKRSEGQRQAPITRRRRRFAGYWG